jgi:bifunctional DNA-binding transcriptional regulator/antitoxin component of YhaV-PrlF toxin-antitoxin module
MRNVRSPRDSVIRPISSGGQVSLPAALRRRWGVKRVVVVDNGDSVTLYPLTEDPLDALTGILKGKGRFDRPFGELWEEYEAEEREVEEADFRRMAGE